MAAIVAMMIICIGLGFLFQVTHAVTIHPKGTFQSKNFAIANMTGFWDGATSFQILGVIQNKGNTTVGPVTLTVMEYDEKNNLLGFDEGYPLLSVLEPSSSSPFKISFVPNNADHFDHYVLSVKAAIANAQTTTTPDTEGVPKINNFYFSMIPFRNWTCSNI